MKLLGAFLISFLLFSSSLCAQVHYGTFASCEVFLNVITRHDSAFLLVNTHSKTSQIARQPRLLIRFFNDSSLSLKGVLVHSDAVSHTIGVAGIGLPYEEFVSNAEFYLTRKQIEMLPLGIMKLRLDMYPNIHNKSWFFDRVGRHLYRQYKGSGSDSFEKEF